MLMCRDSGFTLRVPRNDEQEFSFLLIEPIPLPSRPREPMAAREGDFVKKWFGAAAALLAACPAFAADVAKCTLGADDGKK
jgi:hypothetical protein